MPVYQPVKSTHRLSVAEHQARGLRCRGWFVCAVKGRANVRFDWRRVDPLTGFGVTVLEFLYIHRLLIASFPMYSQDTFWRILNFWIDFAWYNINIKDWKETYNENLTFFVFKCYNWFPSASTNSEDVKKNNPVIFGKLFSARKKLSWSDSPHDLIIILPHFNLYISTKQSMLTVLSLAALMRTEHYLESQPQRRHDVCVLT